MPYRDGNGNGDGITLVAGSETVYGVWGGNGRGLPPNYAPYAQFQAGPHAIEHAVRRAYTSH